MSARRDSSAHGLSGLATLRRSVLRARFCEASLIGGGCPLLELATLPVPLSPEPRIKSSTRFPVEMPLQFSCVSKSVTLITRTPSRLLAVGDGLAADPFQV